jgi:hypothetical protein
MLLASSPGSSTAASSNSRPIRDGCSLAFGDALIWGLRNRFGPAFTPEMQQAWIVLYDAIQAEMMRAAKAT